MKLSSEDAELYFELIWPLQLFVNRRLKILPKVKTVEELKNCPSEKRVAVRDALFENADLIDAFVKDNPEGFPDEKLAIVSKWNHFISGDFYIERLLKKYAVFIGGNNAYAVWALNDPFDAFFHPSQIPFLVKAVLLPFKDKIIFDGILQGYTISFGGGIKRQLKETYMAAKQNGRIIERLGPDSESTRHPKPEKKLKDYSPQVEELAKIAKRLRSEAGQPAIMSPVFSLVRSTLQLARFAVDQPDNMEDIYDLTQKVSKALKKVETVIYRSDMY